MPFVMYNLLCVVVSCTHYSRPALHPAGPLARDPNDTPKHVRSHIATRLRHPQKKPNRVYPSLETAIKTRQRTATTWPGNQTISWEAASQLVQRGVTQLDTNGQVQFRHDPRLTWPSLQYLMAEQVDAIYRDIQCPTALLLAENGWPFDLDAPKNKASIDLLQPSVLRTLPGSHHFHMDPETANEVAQVVVEFLSTTLSE